MAPALTNLTAVVAGLLLAGLVGGQEPPVRSTPPDPGALETAASEIGVLLAEKAERTGVQRKIGSRLLKAVQSAGGQPAAGDAVLADIRADVTPAVLERIRTLGGTVVSQVPRYRAIRARLPLSSVEKLAGLEAVQWIRCADQARTHGQPPGTSTGSESGACERL